MSDSAQATNKGNEHGLAFGLTEKQLSHHVFCNVCGWRKGGIDSWDGAACKCGHRSPTFRELFAGVKL